MAKRKRLSPPLFSDTVLSDMPDHLETRSSAPRSAAGTPPIANVAADAATQAALSDVVETLTRARREGRMVLELDPAQIDPAHLVRDRTRVDETEMQALTSSIAARGQQTPIEVVALEDERYGLISGWRRLTAVTRLGDRPVLALLRAPQDAPEAYLAMIEENEIRVGLSYYERARIVTKAVAGGVFATDKEALQDLFQSASRAKRSKIKSFLPVVTHLDGALRFPEDLGERLGLQLSRALDADATLAPRLIAALAKAPTEADAAAEQSLIQGVLDAKPFAKPSPSQTSGPKPSPVPPARTPSTLRRLVPGLNAESRPDGSLLLSGPAFTPELAREVQDWLRARADTKRL